MLRSIQIILIVILLCGLGGCVGPGYGPTYGYPDYGYSPYSYGIPVYARGYAPNFAVHHAWEEHHAVGHSQSFYHAPPAARSVGHIGGPVAHAGPGGGGHGGDGHR